MGKQRYFDSTLKLFNDYRRKMIKEKPEGYNSNLSNEVYHRLWQLSFIFEKVQEYGQKVTNPIQAINDRLTNTRLFDEGIVFAEAFYSIAWRIIYITKHGTRPLPGLQGMKRKAKGINTVRNNLLVHPEKTKEQIFTLSFSWGIDEGPKFKNARPSAQTFEIIDRGLWINAQEFKDDLEELLHKAIQ